MGNMTPSERPVPPRPAFISMPAAVACAIRHGNSLSDINLCRWADTYATTPERIKDAWEAELSRRSQIPDNQYEVDGK
jgi:hypothetical protein